MWRPCLGWKEGRKCLMQHSKQVITINICKHASIIQENSCQHEVKMDHTGSNTFLAVVEELFFLVFSQEIRVGQVAYRGHDNADYYRNAYIGLLVNNRIICQCV